MLLGLHAAPEILQFRLPVGVGDVLIVPPQAVEPAAQIVNQIDGGKIGTLAGSAISAILSCAWLLMFMPKVSKETAGADE